jgi:hypothetical protein
MTERAAAIGRDFSSVGHGSAFSGATAADAYWNIRFAAQKHQRLGVTAVLKKVNQLRVKRFPALFQPGIELRHLRGNALAVSGFDGIEQGLRRAFDLIFHRAACEN